MTAISNDENRKAIVLATLGCFYPLFSTESGGQLDRCSDRIVAALKMHEHYLFRAIDMLLSEDYFIAVFADGEPIEENEKGGADILNDPKAIFELTQAVDECHLYIFEGQEPASEMLGWVFVTNCNDENESICDYTCGKRARYAAMLDQWMSENSE